MSGKVDELRMPNTTASMLSGLGQYIPRNKTTERAKDFQVRARSLPNIISKDAKSVTMKKKPMQNSTSKGGKRSKDRKSRRSRTRRYKTSRRCVKIEITV